MNRKMLSKAAVCAALSAIIVSAVSGSALADRRYSHGRHYRHHPYNGRVVISTGRVMRPIICGGKNYYYHRGYFYRPGTRGYVVVDAPVGAYINALPGGCKSVIVGGNTYFYYNDVYYARSRNGYIVVSDPVYQCDEPPRGIPVW